MKAAMKPHLIICIILLLFICSCSWLLGVKKLGNGIYYDDELIVKTSTDHYNGVGELIIPPTVKEYRKDENFIIVSTLNGKNQLNYWIIDKTTEGERLRETQDDSLYWGYTKYSNVFGPLDSANFYKLKSLKGIKLVL